MRKFTLKRYNNKYNVCMDLTKLMIYRVYHACNTIQYKNKNKCIVFTLFIFI